MIQFIYGENIYLINKELAKIEQDFLKSDPSAINMEKLEGEDVTLAKFSQAISATPFLADKRLIIIRNLQLENKDSELKQKIVDHLHRIFVQNNADKTTINKKSGAKDFVEIIFVETGSPDKRTKLFKILFKEAMCREFNNLGGTTLTNWIKKEFEFRNIVISQPQLQTLAFECGGDMYKTLTEIEKISLYIKSQKRKIVEDQDISKLVKVGFNPDIFQFIEAIVKKDPKKALLLWFEFMQNGESEHRILSMISYQFRTMIIVKEALELGQRGQDIAKKAGLHPFVVQKTLSLIKNYSLKRLILMFDQLRRTESAIKTDGVPPEIATDILITSFSK